MVDLLNVHNYPLTYDFLAFHVQVLYGCFSVKTILHLPAASPPPPPAPTLSINAGVSYATKHTCTKQANDVYTFIAH